MSYDDDMDRADAEVLRLESENANLRSRLSEAWHVSMHMRDAICNALNDLDDIKSNLERSLQ